MTRFALLPLALLPAFLALDDGAAHEGPRVTLDEAGSEPRKELRYTPAATSEHLFYLDRTVDQEALWDGESILVGGSPGQRFCLHLRATRRESGDGVHLELSHGTLELIPIEGTKEAVSKAQEAHWAPLGEARFTFEVDAHGLLLDTSLEVPEGASPFLIQDLEQLARTIEGLFLPLPAEPAGTKAIWTVRSEARHAHFTGELSRRITLDESGDELGLSVESRYEYPEQSKKPRNNDDLETLRELKGSESRTVRLALDLPLPRLVRARGKEHLELDNLLDMHVREEREWVLEAGVVPVEGGDAEWLANSTLFPRMADHDED